MSDAGQLLVDRLPETASVKYAAMSPAPPPPKPQLARAAPNLDTRQGRRRAQREAHA